VLLAFFGPPALLALLVGRVWKRLRGRPWIVTVQRGLTPVSIGLLVAGSLTFAIVLRSRINPAFLVLAGAIVGLRALR
jgi:chromate transporter